MYRFALHIIFILTVILGVTQPCSAAQVDSTSIYNDVEKSVYQVQVINQQTNKKTAIGSGFVTAAPNILVTNYHVVSTYVNDPESFELHYLSTDDKEGKLTLLTVDVVHDLAVLRAAEPLGTPLKIAGLPAKGARLFSLGNPLDLGFSIIEGTNNGVMKNSDDNNILFSGSLNPGMSGGPALNDTGEVIGVNVATSGNEISFLVPAEYLKAMLERLDKASFQPDDDIDARISDQLQDHANKYIKLLQGAKWTTLSIGKLVVPGDIENYTRCWDNSSKPDPDDLVKVNYTRCSNDNSIYLDDNLEVGSIAYEYIWLEGGDMLPPHFYRAYQVQNASVLDSEAGKNDVTNFACHTAFTDVAGQEYKMTVCRRDYLNYTGLSDVMVTAAMVGHKQQGMLFNMDMQGVDFNNSLQLVKRILGGFKWQK
jgi:hypothetical protein